MEKNHPVVGQTQKELEANIVEITSKNTNTGEVIIYVLNDGNAKVEAISGGISAYGYTPEEFITGEITLQDIIHADDLQSIMAQTWEHLENRLQYFTYDCRIFDKSGTPVWVTNTVMPTYNAGGEATRFFVKFESINRDMQHGHISGDAAEKLLDTSKNTGNDSWEKGNTFRSFFEHSADGIVLVNTNGMIREWSRGYEQITGISQKDAVQHKLWEIFSELLPLEEQNTEEYAVLEHEIKSQINRKQQGIVIRKIVNQVTGQRKTIQVVYFPVNISGTVMLGAISRDITEELRSQELLRQSEQKLRESNEMLESIMEAVPAALYVKNKKGEYIQCNDLFPKIVNLTKEQIIGKTANEIFPESADQINEFDRNQLEETTDSGIVSVYSPKTESMIYRNFLMHNGLKEGIVGVLLDVSELRRTERRLIAEKNRLEALGDHFPNGCLFRLEIDQQTGQMGFTYLSKTWERLTGLGVEETMQDINLSFAKVHPDDLPLMLQHIKSLDEYNDFNSQVRYLYKEGDTRWFQASAHCHLEENQWVYDGFVIDITKRKLAEIELERYRDELKMMVKERTEELETTNEELHTANEELNQYREHLEQMVEQKTHEVTGERERLVSLSKHLTGGVIFQVMGREPQTLRFSFISAYFTRLFGINVNDVMAHSKLFYKSIHPDDRLRFKLHYIKARECGDPGIEFRICNSQGNIKWVHMRASHRITDDGMSIWDGFILDVTPRKLAEQELEDSRSRQNMLYKVLQVFQSTEDVLHAIWFSLAEVGKYTGVDSINIIENNPDNIYEWLKPGMTSLKDRIQAAEVEKLKKAFLRTSAKFIRSSDLPDLAPELLQSHEEVGLLSAISFPLISDGITYGYLCFDGSSTNREWSNNETELLGGISQIFANVIRRQQAETSIRLSHQTLRTVVNNIDAMVLAMDFDTHRILFANRKARDEVGEDIEGKVCWKVLRSGKDGPCEYCPRRYLLNSSKNPVGLYKWESRNNLLGKWFECVDTAVEWVDGRTIHLQHSLDITHRKTAELELIRAKDKAEESDRLKSAFLANMSHEIRTPLNGITGYLQFLTDADLSPELQQEYIQVVNSCSRQLVQLIEDVIDIAKVEADQLNVYPVVTDINKIMCDLLALFEMELKAQNKDRVTLLIDDSDFISPGITYVDPVRLRQTISHMLDNAIKFTHNGYIRFGYKLQPSGMLQFHVEDTGIGIPAEKYEIVFERFRQIEQGNNRFYGGTGIGLSIARSLVQLMGGQMWIESTVGKGSTFSFTIPYIPVAPDDTCHFDEINGSTDMQKPFVDKVVLLVEPGMLKYHYYEKLLVAAGIRVIGAKDPKQWLEHISHSSGIHAIVTGSAAFDDVSNDLVRKINSIHTDVPMIYLGNVHDNGYHVFGKGRNKVVVEEPADYARLIEAVRTVIGS